MNHAQRPLSLGARCLNLKEGVEGWVLCLLLYNLYKHIGQNKHAAMVCENNLTAFFWSLIYIRAHKARKNTAEGLITTCYGPRFESLIQKANPRTFDVISPKIKCLKLLYHQDCTPLI